MGAPSIQVNFAVPFPARVVGVGALSITKANGVFTVQQDYSKLVQSTPQQAQFSSMMLEYYNGVAQKYQKISLADLQAATQAGLPIGIEIGTARPGQALQIGYLPYVEVPCDMTLDSVRVLVDRQGSIQYDIQKCTFAQFAPPTHPVAGDSIVAAAPPAIVNGTSYQDTTLTGWTKLLSKGDILGIYISSANLIQQATISLHGTRNAVPL